MHHYNEQRSKYDFVVRPVDGWHYVVYALDERAMQFLANWLGVKLHAFEHHEVERPFIGAAFKAGFNFCGTS